MYITDMIKMCRFTSPASVVSKRALFRAAALLCILMVTSQLLPVTMAAPDLVRGDKGPKLCLQAVNVCDDASDFTGFLADHPWVSASGIAPPFTGTGIAHVPPPAPGLPEGVPRAVYRPPRTILS